MLATWTGSGAPGATWAMLEAIGDDDNAGDTVVLSGATTMGGVSIGEDAVAWDADCDIIIVKVVVGSVSEVMTAGAVITVAWTHVAIDDARWRVTTCVMYTGISFGSLSIIGRGNLI